jgi:uncharacterized protein (TIGR03083 family)
VTTVETEPSMTSTARRRSALDRPTAMRLAAEEYLRYAEQVRGLAPADWTAPTACPGWDVHAMTAHVLGMAEFAASVPERVRQGRAAGRAGGLFVDALTALQVRKHVHRSPADLVARLSEVGPRAAAGRRRTPWPVRQLPMPRQPVDPRGAAFETWTLGYLVDVILTRDTWMHRSDVAEATGRPMELTPGHDGVLVADVAAEWAARHRRPVVLTLTGPAGGSWLFNATQPGAAEPVEVDAVEFCRALSGRGRRPGLLATPVPF